MALRRLANSTAIAATVAQATPANLQVTATPKAGTSTTVAQATPANLQATVTPAAAATFDVADRAARTLGVVSLSGAYTTPTHTTLAVTTATQAALAANANRRYALLVNDSDAVIYLKLGADAVANEGIRLGASGGFYEMSAAYGNLYTGAINALHAGTGTKVLTILEGV